MSRQILRRGNCCESYVRADANSDHVARHVVENPNPRVEAVGDDIHHARIHDNFNVDIRIIGEKIRQDVTDERSGARLGGADPD